MRFQLRDLATAPRWTVVDDDGLPVFESGAHRDRAEAMAAMGRAVDALRDPTRYRSAAEGAGLALIDDAGRELARARMPRGASVGEFVEERRGDALDRERFRVEVVGAGEAEGAPAPTAPSREDLDEEYDYSVTGFANEPGLHFAADGAPYRFLYRDERGRGIVYSRDYADEPRYRAALRALLRNARASRVRRWAAGGRHYFRIADARGGEVARSPGFAEERDREAAVAYFLASADDQRERVEAALRTFRAGDFPLGATGGRGQPGFEEFRLGGRFYFAFNDEGGVPLLLSRGYRASYAAQAGLLAVVRYGAHAARYRLRETEGRVAVVLLGEGDVELGRTRTFPSREEATRHRDYLGAEMTARADELGLLGGDAEAWPPAGPAALEFELLRPLPAPPPPTPTNRPPAMAHDPNPARRQDNYLVCSAYEARVDDAKHPKHDDVIVFTHDNGLHYFAILTADGDAVALRSEGYPTVGARETGLKSVLRFRGKRTRYKIEETRGMFFTLLTAQNGQEIARSCPKASAGEAEGLWPAVSAASAALAARAAEEAAAAAAAETAAAAEAAAPHDPNPARREDNYLVCSAYRARVGDSRHPKHADVIAFTHDNGLHYFATLTEAGEIALRSEGYPTTGARDNGLKSVLRFREKRTRFKTERRRNLYFAVLYAQNGQEIARSCPKPSDDDAGLLLPGLGAAAVALAARTAVAPASAEEPSAPATAPAETPGAAGLAGGVAAGAAALGGGGAIEPPPGPPADREDDYLACKEYRGRGLTDPANRVSLFRHENGQYYFALLDASGGVRLRSEGFPTAAARDRELSGALRHVDDESRYERIARGDYHINVLRDETGREVGRSCARKEVVPFVPVAASGAAALAAAAPAAALAAAAATPPPPTPSPEPLTPPPTDDKGGCAWWMWALAALLLLALLFFLLRGCGGAATADTDAAGVDAVGTAAAPPGEGDDAGDLAAGAAAVAGAAAAPDDAELEEPAPAPEPEPAPAAAAAPPPPLAPARGGEGLGCGSIAVDAPYNERGVPELPVDVFAGIAGEVQVFLQSGDGRTAAFPLDDLEFAPPGNELAVEPCSVGDVDRLAAVLRANPDAVVTVSAATRDNCETLARLFDYRGVGRDRIAIRPSDANELLVTQ